ncbi:phosphoribosylanthranilate isomerase [Staphylococcus hominis]|uniref:phosphoribosylanthranilate isomerase n=1 Tax=Staphylococcus hominis TaxID=1290 RepID=UPI00119EC633|nr:phosphoribosylanthranilate isomerase [Staphylococcus hominis]
MNILKFCGFKTKSDILKANSLDIDMIGFIHYPKSKRHLNIEKINYLNQFVAKHIHRVIVVVNPTYKELNTLLQQTNVNGIQFHGNETIELIQKVKLNFKNIKIIKALPATENLNRDMNQYKPWVDLFIIDTPSIQFGGTGQTFNWKILESVSQDIPYLIAGGINISAIQQIEKLDLSHKGYDISSGIETNECKDKLKMETIINYVKGSLEYETDTNGSK